MPNKNAPSLLHTNDIPIKGQRSYWHLPSLSEKALAVVQKTLEYSGLVVYLTATSEEASKLEGSLRFFCQKRFPIMTFPDWETLPYDHFSPHQDIISQRLKTLHRLPQTQQGLLVLPISTLIQKVVPRDYLEKYTFLLNVGQTLDQETFVSQLEIGGYQRVSQVSEHGDFAVRGALIDLFPMGSQRPFRLDLFDDEIESIRRFDPETQRTIDQVESIEFLPAKEYDLSDEGIALFRQNFRERFEETGRQSHLYKAVSEKHTLDGLEYYLPLFHPSVETLFDYLPDNALFFDHNGVGSAIDQAWQDYNERYDIAKLQPDYPVLPPSELILDEHSVMAHLKGFHRISLTETLETKNGAIDFDLQALPPLEIDSQSEYPLARINAFLDQYPGRVLITAESNGRRETLLTLFKQHRLTRFSKPEPLDSWLAFAENSKISEAVTVAPLETSFATSDFAVIAEAQIFGQTVIQKRRRKRKHDDFDTAVSNLIELEIGSPIVHIDHGVGRYVGLETMQIQGEDHELLTIEYAEGAKLYVPVTSLHLISRYTGASPESAPLHKLGSDKWDKAKRKAAEKVRDVAAELLDIYAQREARKGQSFETDESAYLRFASAFPFEETPDQQAAIEAVLTDMKSDKPMDRLICGDVGFGKTEVAMRAAFVAAYAGKQVAVLVPTTLLSQQHLENFQNRFADWPIKVAGLSRFQTAKQTKETLQAVAEGTVDIVIGTHKLIQKDVQFKRLGLIIIDEEHRFGVRQKEQLKKLRAEVDVLTMTATPIPRTLNMAMNDLRSLSIIATPPAKRLSVQTFVQDWNDDLVREACLREIRRGGQIYLLFNEVDKIDAMAERIERLVPEAGVRTAHGQMNERELEGVMQDFYHRRFQILVCTTIIETGIDIPTANTILIHRADKFGLAQLHQLRGRVGRSHHKAYAYLFTAGKALLTKDAEKRLEAISRHDTLGAGFMLASHDLEIRGAGELLGEGQSGQIMEVGFGLYMELLERAVKALKSGKQPELSVELHHGTEVDLGVPSLIPEDYLPDIHTRLVFYKRIASAPSKEALQELEVEMIDRFGLLPLQTKHLFAATRIKLMSGVLNLMKIDAYEDWIRIQFGKAPHIEPIKLIQLIQRFPKDYKLKGQTELKYFAKMPNIDQRVSAIELILRSIAPEGVTID